VACGKAAAATVGAPALVSLTEDIAKILESLPRFNQGTYLFSFTNGTKSIWISIKVKVTDYTATPSSPKQLPGPPMALSDMRERYDRPALVIWPGLDKPGQ
jgi:hypothetical protein